MSNITGVAPLFREFKIHLGKNKERLAPLHLVGRLEDYLTKEFASVIFEKSGGSVLPIGNFGHHSDGGRIDLVLTKGNVSKALDKRSWKKLNPLRVYALVELKYVRNRHRATFSDATDETSSALGSLSQQLGRTIEDKYAGISVKLNARKFKLYGVVFASFVCRREEYFPHGRLDERLFIERIKRAASDRFQSHTFKAAVLKPVYSKVPVKVLKGEYLVWLYAGLWRIKVLPTGENLDATPVSRD